MSFSITLTLWSQAPPLYSVDSKSIGYSENTIIHVYMAAVHTSHMCMLELIIYRIEFCKSKIMKGKNFQRKDNC